MPKKESIQQKIARIRPPRVQITYDVETGGAIEMKELPFVMGVLGDFTGQPSEPLPRLSLEANYYNVKVDGAIQAIDAYEEALRLRLSPGAPVYRFNRIRFADDVPMCLEYATIVATALPSLDAVDVSMYEALEKTGHRPVRALQRLSALLLNAEQAELLHTRVGDAGLAVERLGFLRDGRAVEFCRSIFRGDMYDFVAELSTP